MVESTRITPPDFDLSCRIYVHSTQTYEDFVAAVAQLGGGRRNYNHIAIRSLDVLVDENDMFDVAKAQTGPKRWLSFRYQLEIEPSQGTLAADYIADVGKLLQALWSAGVDAVAAAEFEADLPVNQRRATWDGSYAAASWAD